MILDKGRATGRLRRLWGARHETGIWGLNCRSGGHDARFGRPGADAGCRQRRRHPVGLPADLDPRTDLRHRITDGPRNAPPAAQHPDRRRAGAGADPRAGDRRLLRRPPQPELQRHRRPRAADPGLSGGIGGDHHDPDLRRDHLARPVCRPGHRRRRDDVAPREGRAAGQRVPDQRLHQPGQGCLQLSAPLAAEPERPEPRPRRAALPWAGEEPDPATDGGFPSGHTNAAYLSALALAYAVPQRFQELLTRASELGDNRIEAGMHAPTDVIGGRVLATYFAIRALNDPANAALLGEAFAQAQSYLSQACGGPLERCAHAPVDPATDRFSDYARNKAAYTARLTYGLPPVGPTDLPPVVPAGAEALLATRFPYLTAAQRRDVIATTELPSGGFLDNGLGYDRINLFAAADGYGAFNGTVTVTLDAAKGGFSAYDVWRNDIGGAGSLVKLGSGTLVLTGANTYAGGTTIGGGTLVGHAGAFGTGAILDNAALVVDQSVDGTMANAIAGSGTLAKTNSGALTLTGISTLTGATTVEAGQLVVNGSLANSLVTVRQGAGLGGSGTVGGIRVLAGGTVAPGNSIGTLTIAGNAAFAAGSTYRVEANAAGRPTASPPGAKPRCRAASSRFWPPRAPTTRAPPTRSCRPPAASRASSRA
ncbi:phosphatase PAP2 family protein [Methylobacterium tardum]|uniref:autotransporter-associated beta strand repeat-containing protein n=1 Tax=Methylobacterium tardum TaxID=374432 RepID=UPI00202289E9|nr:autotransporter-associated beta strand repeat-containing protein [Methylobacterium tardum]URD37851.1 phosphatase PAP2 family protein [Methylobacterium tardum]